MRRNILHISVALLAFTVGFIFAVPYEYLAIALPLALLTFMLAKIIPRLDFSLVFDLHTLCVLAVSLLFWTAGGAMLFEFLSASNSDCVVEFPDAAVPPAVVSVNYLPVLVSAESGYGTATGTTAFLCAGTDVDPSAFNPVWAGAIDGKAVAKPAPLYPPLAKAGRIQGTVAVSILVDDSGRVVWAQAVSGHKLLRQAAMDAACRARFRPTFVDGPPVRASGVLTYKFWL